MADSGGPLAHGRWSGGASPPLPTVHAKWHVIPFNGFSTVHQGDRYTDSSMTWLKTDTSLTELRIVLFLARCSKITYDTHKYILVVQI